MRFSRSRTRVIFAIFSLSITAFVYVSFLRSADSHLFRSISSPSSVGRTEHQARLSGRQNRSSILNPLAWPGSLKAKGIAIEEWQDTFHDHAASDSAGFTEHRNGKSRPACYIPVVNPFNELAEKEIVDVGSINCASKDFAYALSGSLFLKGERLRYAHFQYIERPFGDDSQYLLSEPVQLVQPEKDKIRPGNLGCLLAEDSKILEFEDDLHVVSATDCVPGGFLEILEDGSIRNLEGKHLTVQDCSTKKCMLVLSFITDGSTTKFLFEADGRIKHAETEMCLVFGNDTFGDYDELILLADCEHPASRWTMWSYPEKDLNIKASLSGDFVKLSLVHQKTHYTEYHATIVPKYADFMEHEESLPEQHDMPNIALIVIDSQSAANVERKMPKFIKQLKTSENAVLFKGHTIVGDGTTDQLCAMLAGKLEKDLPIALKSTRNSVFVDEWGFIFSEFRDEGYVTFFSEDDVDYPAFNYRLNGFYRPPTDHYARAFWQCASGETDNDRCVGRRPRHKVNLDYTESLFDAYANQSKFSVTVLSSLSHNNINNVQYIEDDLIVFLSNMKKKGHVSNTFIFILGDHGLRASVYRLSFAGWLEERLPFFAFLAPDSFLRTDADRRKAIRENARFLTSHFDIYATLKDILNTTYSDRSSKGESLLKPIEFSKRSCVSAGVDSHWCPCSRFKSLRHDDAQRILVAKAVVDYINLLLMNGGVTSRCARLELESIQRVSYSLHANVDLVDRNSNETHYLVAISVSPSGGLYEASVIKHHSGILSVDPSISRLDLYGSQSICIINDQPNLRKFCYCIDKRW